MNENSLMKREKWLLEWQCVAHHEYSLHRDLQGPGAPRQNAGRALEGARVSVGEVGEAEPRPRPRLRPAWPRCPAAAGWGQGDVVVFEFWVHIPGVQFIGQLRIKCYVILNTQHLHTSGLNGGVILFFWRSDQSIGAKKGCSITSSTSLTLPRRRSGFLFISLEMISRASADTCRG